MPRFSSPATRCGLITAEDRRGGLSCRDWLESPHCRTGDRRISAQQSFMLAYRRLNVICREVSCAIFSRFCITFEFNFFSFTRMTVSHSGEVSRRIVKLLLNNMNSKEFRRKWHLPNFNYIYLFPEEGLAWTKYVEDVDMHILSSVCSVCI